MIFVYVKGIRGPTPEKWPELLIDMAGKPRPTLAMHRLDDKDAKQPIEYLTMKYPPPGQAIETKIKIGAGVPDTIDVRPNT